MRSRKKGTMANRSTRFIGATKNWIFRGEHARRIWKKQNQFWLKKILIWSQYVPKAICRCTSFVNLLMFHLFIKKSRYTEKITNYPNKHFSKRIKKNFQQKSFQIDFTFLSYFSETILKGAQEHLTASKYLPGHKIFNIDYKCNFFRYW